MWEQELEVEKEEVKKNWMKCTADIEVVQLM